MEEAIRLLDIDLNEALNVFNCCLTKVADCMKKKIHISKHAKEADWYDMECGVSKRNVRRLLNKYRRTLSNPDREAFCIARREYKRLLKRKEKQFNDTLINQLISSVNNQKDFWNTVHRISFKRKQPANNIGVDMWFQHFKELLERNVDNDGTLIHVSDVSVDDNYVDNDLNRPISKEEVLLALRKLKQRKAAGPDGIIGEILKNACNSVLVLEFLVKMFNALFDSGVYPDCWTESIVLPLFKKGDASNPNNYRGISLCNVSSKLYGAIINRRLQEWVKENNITCSL
jgi:hypothetical protein